MTHKTLTVSIYRFNPEVDQKPYMQNYSVDLQQVQGKMLLDVICYLKDHQDSTLSFRRSCGEGVCGSDGMNINGKNGLACITEISSLPERVELRPLPGFPVIRDLVVDMTQFYEHYERVKPYLINEDDEDEPLERERLQSPEERARLDGYYECILCGCCTASCPSYWWNPEKYLGPAALLQAYRFLVDTRDTNTIERLAELQGPFPVFRCRTIMNCTTVCPKGLNPAKAINAIKVSLVNHMGE